MKKFSLILLVAFAFISGQLYAQSNLYGRPDSNSWLVYDTNLLDIRSLTMGRSYYFSIESLNDKGISKAIDSLGLIDK